MGCENFIIFYHKNKQEFDEIINLSREVGVKIKTDFSKIDEFPYIMIDTRRDILTLTCITQLESDRYGFNSKEFIGIKRYLSWIKERNIRNEKYI